MVTKKLVGDEIEVLISHILSLAAAFVASANSVRIFLDLYDLFVLLNAYLPHMKQLFEKSVLLKLAEIFLEDLLVAIGDPGCAK